MLTPTGAKLLDFGLAKPAAPALTAVTLTAATPPSPMTEEGTIVAAQAAHPGPAEISPLSTRAGPAAGGRFYTGTVVCRNRIG